MKIGELEQEWIDQVLNYHKSRVAGLMRTLERSPDLDTASDREQYFYHQGKWEGFVKCLHMLKDNDPEDEVES